MKKNRVLTNREYEIFDLLIQGDSTTTIASKMCISDKTVRNHISNVIMKLGVCDRTQAVLELLRLQEFRL